MAVASAIPSSGKGSISPSTLTRYLSGERCPSIGQACRIAAALGLDPVELVLGYADDRRARQTTWDSDLARKSRLPLGIDLQRFFGQSGHYLKHLYVDVVEGGPYRRAFRTVEGEIGFASIPVRVAAGDLPAAIRFLYRSRFVPGLPLISDVGTVLIDARSIRIHENWTLREETRPRRNPSDPFRVRFWQDKRATTFFLISEAPFEALIDEQVVHVGEPDADECAVTFHPTGFHHFTAGPAD
jgi:transcriptional regulator with XRE-family HTH domain